MKQHLFLPLYLDLFATADLYKLRLVLGPSTVANSATIVKIKTKACCCVSFRTSHRREMSRLWQGKTKKGKESWHRSNFRRGDIWGCKKKINDCCSFVTPPRCNCFVSFNLKKIVALSPSAFDPIMRGCTFQQVSQFVSFLTKIMKRSGYK